MATRSVGITHKKPGNPKKAKKFFEEKLAYTLGPADIQAMFDRGEHPKIIDVRSADDYEEGHVPGAIHLPKDQWHATRGLSKREPNIFYCYSQTCHLAPRAALFFASRGFPVVEMEGGFDTWKEDGYDIETGKSSAIGLKPKAA